MICGLSLLSCPRLWPSEFMYGPQMGFPVPRVGRKPPRARVCHIWGGGSRGSFQSPFEHGHHPFKIYATGRPSHRQISSGPGLRKTLLSPRILVLYRQVYLGRLTHLQIFGYKFSLIKWCPPSLPPPELRAQAGFTSQDAVCCWPTGGSPQAEGTEGTRQHCLLRKRFLLSFCQTLPSCFRG